jgi:hypothetical protein
VFSVEVEWRTSRQAEFNAFFVCSYFERRNAKAVVWSSCQGLQVKKPGHRSRTRVAGQFQNGQRRPRVPVYEPAGMRPTPVHSNGLLFTFVFLILDLREPLRISACVHVKGCGAYGTRVRGAVRLLPVRMWLSKRGQRSSACRMLIGHRIARTFQPRLCRQEECTEVWRQSRL